MPRQPNLATLQAQTYQSAFDRWVVAHTALQAPTQQRNYTPVCELLEHFTQWTRDNHASPTMSAITFRRHVAAYVGRAFCERVVKAGGLTRVRLTLQGARLV